MTKHSRSAAQSPMGHIVEFRTAAGESLAISVLGTEAALLKHFQARMPYGLVVPDVRPPSRRTHKV
jgi:hypothetical protein